MIPLGLTAAAPATKQAIHKKMFGLGRPLDLSSCMTKLIIDIMKIDQSLEECGL